MKHFQVALLLALPACGSDPHYVGLLDREVIACVTAPRAPEDDVCAPDSCLWLEVTECPEGYRATCFSSFGDVKLYHNAWFYWLCDS